MRRLAIPVALLIVAAWSAAGCSDPTKKKQAFLESGNRYAASERFEEAALEYQNAIQVDPLYGEARVKLAETYVRLGKPANALEEYVRAADLLPGDIGVQLTAGGHLLLAGRADDARARASAVLSREPKNIDAHILLGNALAGLKNFEAAVAQIEEAIKLEPGRSASYTSLGAVELARGSQDLAERAFKTAVALDPNQVVGHLALANHYWAAERLEDAERSINAALRVDPSNPLANRAMALFCMTTGRVADAERYVTAMARSASAPLALVDYYLVAGRPRDAIRELELLESDRRFSAAAERRLVSAYAAAGDGVRSRELVDGILSRNPRDAEMVLVKGQLLSAAGKSEEALEQIKAAADVAPGFAPAQFALGKLLAARGDTEGAKRAFNEVLKLNPRAAAAHVELARIYLMDGSPAESLRSAKEAFRTQPENIDVSLTLANSLLASGDIAAAEKTIQALLATEPKLASVHVLRGRLAVGRKDLRGAREAFETALRLDLNSVAALSGLILLDLSAQKFAEAKARIAAEIERRPGRVELLIVAAQVYSAANELDAAERVLRQAIDVNPSLLPAYGRLAAILVQQQRLDEAVREFDALADRQSNAVGPLTISGMILQAQGKNALARQRFEKALALDPRTPVAANNLAWMYADAGESLDIALQLAQTAVAGLPDSAEALDTLGWVYYRKQLSSSAVSTLKRTVEQDPKNAVYHYHLGMAYVQAGEASLARQSLERALSLSGTFAGADHAKRALSELQAAGTAPPG
jgi:tetratricopeptide (TPR) repeat protein